jgi:hypothetical protein
MTKKLIMDIPDALLLTVAEISELKAIFKKRLRQEPDVVVLPALGFWGASFESDYFDQSVPKVVQTDGTKTRGISVHDLQTLIDITHQELPKAEIYLSFNMAFEFLQSEYTCTYDQYGQSSSQACIVNPSVNKILKKFIDEVVSRFNPDGLVLDLVDINPQSGDEKTNSVKLHCFCSHCSEKLSLLSISKHDFIDTPNALNLVLKPTSSGMSYVSIDPTWKRPEDVIIASQSKKIYDEAVVKDSARGWATKILGYVKARSSLTAEAVQALLKDVPPSVKKAIIVDGARFEWTSGISPFALKDIVDQVWMQVETFTGQAPEGVEFYHYMFTRARYTLDAFFNILSDRRLLAAASVDEEIFGRIREQAQSRALKVMSANQLNLAGLNVATENDLISGIVGVPLDPVENTLVQKLIETYAPVVDMPDGGQLGLLRELLARNV